MQMFYSHCSMLSRRVLIYQKRWVKLDAFYLRYFDNEKVRRSLMLAPLLAKQRSVGAKYD